MQISVKSNLSSLVSLISQFSLFQGYNPKICEYPLSRWLVNQHIFFILKDVSARVWIAQNHITATPKMIRGHAVNLTDVYDIIW